jgi:hypothetical protein
MWKHGLRSIETIERRREMTAEMRRIRREITPAFVDDVPDTTGAADGKLRIGRPPG